MPASRRLKAFYAFSVVVAAVILGGCKSRSTEEGRTSGPQAKASAKVPSPQEIALDEILSQEIALDEIRDGSASSQDDVQINDHAGRAPRHLTPVEEGGQLSDGPDGLPFVYQFFLFNPLTKQVGIAGGSDLPNGINLWGSYGNTLIDSSRLKGYKRLSLGLVLVQSERTLMFYGEGCAEVGISFEEHARAMISPNYVVSPVDPGQTQEGQTTGYSVVVFFDPREHKEPGVPPTKQKFVSGTLSVSRNGSPPAHFPLSFSPATTPSDIDNVPLAATGFPAIELLNIHRKTDIVEWSVEQSGRVTLKGAFGFPVVGTVPKLVYYRVDLPQGVHGNGTRSSEVIGSDLHTPALN